MYQLRDIEPPAQLLVDHGDRLGRPYAARIEVTSDRSPLLFRVVAFGRPLAWLRGSSNLYEPAILTAALPAQTGGLEPLPVRAAPRAAPGSDAWWSAWSRYFVGALRRAPRGALPRGTYRFAPEVVLTPQHPALPAAREADARHYAVGVALSEDSFAPPPAVARVADSWRPLVLLTRVPSRPDAARVRMYRKRAREGVLAPLVLWCIPMYDPFYVLLDGHDRLLAALLEGVRPRAFMLTALTATGWPLATDEARQRARRCCVCAWPLPGGAARWRAEASARFAELAQAVPADERASLRDWS